MSDLFYEARHTRLQRFLCAMRNGVRVRPTHSNRSQHTDEAKVKTKLHKPKQMKIKVEDDTTTPAPPAPHNSIARPGCQHEPAPRAAHPTRRGARAADPAGGQPPRACPAGPPAAPPPPCCDGQCPSCMTACETGPNSVWLQLSAVTA